MTPHNLNILGLFASAIGAAIMLIWPIYSPGILHTDEGKKKELRFYGEPSPSFWEVWRARLGPILLFLGFVLQIIGTW
jgi:hypothetical protein